MNMTLSELIALTTDRIVTPLRRWWIDRQIEHAYRELNYFKDQVDNGNRGMQYTMRRIVNLQNTKGL